MDLKVEFDDDTKEALDRVGFFSSGIFPLLYARFSGVQYMLLFIRDSFKKRQLAEAPRTEIQLRSDVSTIRYICLLEEVISVLSVFTR